MSTLKFAANLSLLFTERPLLERFSAARAAGFDAVEIQFPYSLERECIQRELKAHQLELVLINIPAGDWEAGERGLACLPGREAEFSVAVNQAIEWAQQLGVPRLNCLAGVRPQGISVEQSKHTLAHNLTLAADRCHSAGIQLMIEAINTQDIPGFCLHQSAQVIDLIDQLQLPSTALQYDVYHMQIMEGNLISTLQQNADKIGHIQIADVPGRHEPGTGEINYTNLFRALEQIGYSGHISLEYNPKATTEAGLGWLATWMTQDRTR
ncbi:hydroxypyruvate isomerase [Marinobacterium halophilum]|uniref:Hydroxypyruvate isomerase n=1 Tax=Marinobacterium halophilum TaxID=267374 RepID=A0A2P8EKI1_9GAMM|nr:hydroxypyruvate isomerase [Marinobacterium halophilum]PSL09987.1 hydroxypyruvate isomerase [Marinobacterium halophilum]